MGRPLIVDKRMTGKRGETYTASNVSQLADLMNVHDTKIRDILRRLMLLEKEDGLTSATVTPILGSGTVNYLPKWSAADTLADSAVYEAGGKVCIGHALPEYAELDILGTNAIQYLRVSGLTHGMTDVCPTNVFGILAENGVGSSGDAGGLVVSGLGTKYPSIKLRGLSGDAAMGSNPSVDITCGKKSGTYYADIAATEIALRVKQDYSGTSLLTVLGNGNTTITGSLTASIAALGSTATTFLTHTAGLVQSRTAAEVLSDVGAAATVHTHSKLVASDGLPDPALNVDATGQVGIGISSPRSLFEISNGSLYLSYTGIAHGRTSLLPTDVYGSIGPLNTAQGGLNFYAASATNQAAMWFMPIVGSTSPTVAPFAIDAYKTNVGTSWSPLAATEPLFDLMTNGATVFRVIGDGSVLTNGVYKVDGVQVVSNRVIDARIDDAISSGDATTDGVIDAMRDAMIAHGLMAAA